MTESREYNRQDISGDSSEDIRGVLIQVLGGRVLLPNATVSEVITLSDPELVPNAPDWLLGRVPWRGWRLPLFSFGVLSGLATHEPAETARVSVLKALGRHKRIPFIAMLAQGFPRLTTLRSDLVVPVESEEELPHCVLARVSVRDDIALIPDMDAIEDMIAEALDHEAEAPADA